MNGTILWNSHLEEGTFQCLCSIDGMHFPQPIIDMVRLLCNDIMEYDSG